MTRRSFDVIDVVEILQHWHAGRPKARIAASLGVDRATIRKYVAPAEAAGLEPGGPPIGRAEWAELVRDWFPELIDAKARSLTFPVINAHRERIETMLGTNTVTTVWQRLRDEHGLAVGISSFRRYVWLEFPDHASPDRVTVLRPPVPPGEEAQIDWGFLGSWWDPTAERARRIQRPYLEVPVVEKAVAAVEVDEGTAPPGDGCLDRGHPGGIYFGPSLGLIRAAGLLVLHPRPSSPAETAERERLPGT